MKLLKPHNNIQTILVLQQQHEHVMGVTLLRECEHATHNTTNHFKSMGESVFIPKSRRPNNHKTHFPQHVCMYVWAVLLWSGPTFFQKFCHVCWRKGVGKPHVWCWRSSTTLCVAIVPRVALTFGTVRTYESWKWDTCETRQFWCPWGSTVVSCLVDRAYAFPATLLFSEHFGGGY